MRRAGMPGQRLLGTGLNSNEEMKPKNLNHATYIYQLSFQSSTVGLHMATKVCHLSVVFKATLHALFW